MPTMLETLNEQLDALDAEFESYASPLIAENRALTPEEDTKVESIRARRTQLSERIVKAEADAALAAEVVEARVRLGTATPVVVKDEPRTYGPETGNSYFADLCWAAMPGDRHFRDACTRLDRHATEMVRDAVNDPVQRSRVITSAKQHYRDDESRARQFIDDVSGRRLEVRTGMDTGTTSGGSFVTPQYFVADYAPWRTFGRVFADLCNKQDLPDYGMTVYLPALSGPAGVASQANQGNGVQETDPTAGYLSAGLTTEAGQVIVSQQLLDRAGPNFAFDKMVFDQLQRAYATALDTAWITAALANGGQILDGSTTSTAYAIVTDLYSDTAQAYAAIETAAGTVLAPTHIFATPTQWAFIASQVDSNGRPLLVPQYAGPFNAIGSTMGRGENVVPEGDTGYEVMSLPVFKDGNIPASSYSGSDTQIIVAHMPEVWAWEGALVPRTIPQTYAQNLQVLLQLYSYNCVIVRYPKAVQSITGARYPKTPTFPNA